MKFIEASADIPNELIRAVNDSEVVFLCGAGVSRGVGLPLFQALTDTVYTKLGESRENEAAERIA
jgi:NAD-dependent SIR2 family protein deacetylase